MKLKRPNLRKKKKSATNGIDFPFADVQGQLDRYEAIEKREQEIEQENEEIFTELSELAEEKEGLRQTMRRLAYSKVGPPSGVKGRMFYPVAGARLEVSVTYKKRSDFYDPTELPSSALTSVGVVRDVDTVAVDAVLERLEATDGLSKKQQRHIAEIKAAKRTGDWMTPALSIKRKRS